MFLIYRELREGLEQIKLSSQQEYSKSSPRTQAACARAGTGRRSGTLLAAIKSLAADIAAIKLAVPAVNIEEGQQRLKHPGAVHHTLDSASASAAQELGDTSRSKLVQTRAKSTGVVPLLQQGRRPPTHVPCNPVTMVHLVHDLDVLNSRPAKLLTPSASHAEPLEAASHAPAGSLTSSTSVTQGPGPSTPSPACATSQPAVTAVEPAISESNNVSTCSSPFLSSAPPLPPPLLEFADSAGSPSLVDNALPLVSRDKGCLLFIEIIHAE